ncbi:MAG: tripartite tricarboxylate transporter permease [Nanoarchaeota archaeon]|nr:tripartite tricarboxylate transporter permease [Nanoarchaeota archaeon]
MLIGFLFFLIIGIIAGTITGLIPGIHINLIGALLIFLSTSIFINPIYSIIFISSMAITHTFIDFIPSILLGCPDTDTELSILPGHELLKNKKGFEAIYLSNLGSINAIFILVIISIPSIFLIEKIYPFFQNIIPYLLILIAIILILTEKNKIPALIVFLITGFFGYGVSFIEFNQPLLPLLTGLFGASNLILSIKNKTKIPEQEISKPKIKIKKPIFAAALTAPFCSFLPSIGSGQAAVIASTFTKINKKQFLVLLGTINTLVMAFSFITLYTIQKTRTGASLAINELSSLLEFKHLILILIVVIISGIIAFYLTNILAEFFSKKIQKINYTKISIITLTFLSIIVLSVSGIKGFLILITSTLIGIFSIIQKVRRTNMMGVLIIPTIIWYLF